jgi:hypothetical protein
MKVKVKTGKQKVPEPKSKKESSSASAPIGFWPSHTPISDLIGFCTRGNSHPVLQCGHAGDHIAETIELYLDDTDSYLWNQKAVPEGSNAFRIFERLNARIHESNDVRAAEILYAIATLASREVLGLYLRHPDLFKQIAPRRNFLPSLFSIHPNTAKITAQMLRESQLGAQTPHARHTGSRAYFVSDSPANIYARAIIKCVEFNRELEPVSCQQYGWRKFDRKEHMQTIVLPFPDYVEGLDSLPVPITPESVPAYWRKGKEIILEEMPDFHELPEWENYYRRRYKTGAKDGAVRNAIFKDILVALKTIAGTNNRRTGSKMVTK